MSYQLERYEPIPDGIKRILTEQVDKALDSLKDSNDILDEQIHDARKRFKKIRAVMRLVRDEIGEDVYQYENTCYRDAGRALSDLRDSAVAIETFDKLTDHYADALRHDQLKDVRHQLVMHVREERHKVLTNQTLYKLEAVIRTARSRIDDLPIDAMDFSAFHDGLKRVYKRGYKGFKHAYNKPKPENFHEWRKRVKYLWYNMRILRYLWDDVQKEVADDMHTLADYLGDAHDLAVFDTWITPSITGDAELAETLKDAASRWRKELETTAHPLAQRIYAEKPKRFTKRMKKYWKATELEATLS